MARKISVFLLSLILIATVAFMVVAFVDSSSLGGLQQSDATQGVENAATTGTANSGNGNASNSGTITDNGNVSDTNTAGGGNNTSNPDAANGGNNSSDSGTTGPTHACVFVFNGTVPADCGNKGYTLYTCSCGKSEKRNFKPATGEHQFTTVVHKATCKDNWYQVDECKVCGAVDSNTKIEVPRSTVPHSYSWQVTKEASCTEDGEKSGKCIWCGETTTEVIPALEHEFENGYCQKCHKYKDPDED